MVNSQSSSLLSYQQHVTQTLPFLLPIRISGSLGFSTSLISPSQPFWLVHLPLLDSLMLKCAKAQSLALFPSPSKSTPWWYLLVHSCKYHVLADNHQLCIYSSNFSLKIFRCIFSTVYWVSVLGYPVSIIFSTCPLWTPNQFQLITLPFQESEMKGRLLDELCIRKRLNGSR